MKKLVFCVLCAILVLPLFIVQNILAGSVLQISAEPGISIWLNKELVGKTTKEQNGLLISDLAPGEYVLKASMEGYEPAETMLTIKDNQTIEWRIKQKKPSLQVEDNVTRIESAMTRSAPTGTLYLKSMPLNAEIYFDGQSIGAADKRLTYVPASEHTVKFVFQNRELVKKFSLKPEESMTLMADFSKSEILGTAAKNQSKQGPEIIKMQSSTKRKPAIFPHRKHQEMYDCAKCHHGMDSEGKQVAYSEGMEIQHCATCHNPKMENKQLNNLRLAAHTRCKGCHKKIVAESGTAGPIDRCNGCHIVEE